MRNKIIFIISLGTVFLWLSLFFSYTELPNAYHNMNISEPIATGGFPLKAFEYPVPPMGNDWPPSNAWFPFFINFIIWLCVSTFLTSLFFEKETENRKWLIRIIPFLAIIFSIVGVVYITFKFD